MALVNITQAAKLAGITRQYMYSHYIKTGKITVSKDKDNKPQIDTSEILRVFGEIKSVNNITDNSLLNVTPNDTQEITHKNNDLTGELKLMRELLDEKDKRIEDLQYSIRLLSDKSEKRGFLAKFLRI